jgi:tRNA (guanine-N7-)-methyltransferase
MCVTEHPPIRTFHARHGRLSKARLAAIENLIPRLEIANEASPIDLRQVFNGKRVIVDFGCGMGHHTRALQTTDVGILAIDVHTPGMCQIAMWADYENWDNVRIHHGDGVTLLTSDIKPGSVDELHVMFPDPWPKIRQYKRRLIQEPFLELADKLLSNEGFVLIITDDDSYAEFIEDVIAQSKYFMRSMVDVVIPDTRYRKRADKLAHTIHTYKLVRK